MNNFENQPTKKISKGTILLRKGEYCNVAYKVVKGCLRSYVIDKSGKEHIFQFAPEDWIISDMDAFLNNKPASIFIDALEDTEVILVSKTMVASIDEWEKDQIKEQYQKLLRNVITTNKRLISLLSSTAEERYSEFVETYPALLQRLPLKLIASYLGMTPEYLSEIRRKQMKR